MSAPPWRTSRQGSRHGLRSLTIKSVDEVVGHAVHDDPADL